MRIPPVVAQAFETPPQKIKEETKSVNESGSETGSESKDILSVKEDLLLEIDNKFSAADKSKNISEEDRKQFDELLKNSGFKTPKTSIKKISTYISEFKKMIEKTKGKVDWVKALQRSKKKKSKEETPPTTILTPVSKLKFKDVEKFLEKQMENDAKTPKTKRTPQKKTTELQKFAYGDDSEKLFFEDETKKL